MLGHTSIDAWKLSPEINEGGQFVDSVLFGVAMVVHLDEGDVQRVRLLVDLLKTFQHLLAIKTIVGVWKWVFLIFTKIDFKVLLWPTTKKF